MRDLIQDLLTGLLLLVILIVIVFFMAAVVTDGQEQDGGKCVAREYVSYTASAKTDKVEEHHDWSVQCTVRKKGKMIYDRFLVLPHHTTRREALDAIDDFMEHKFKEIWAEGK